MRIAVLSKEVSVQSLAIPATRVALIFGFAAGWHEPEFNPRTGTQWRWLSERGELQIRAGVPGMVLHIEGESPRKYFSRGSRLVVTAGNAAPLVRMLDDDFSIDVPLDGVVTQIALQTDQTYVPAERSRRSQDRRRLGLRIFKVEIRP